MAIIKKIMWGTLLGAVGLVLYRFVRIVVRVLTEKPAPGAKARIPKAAHNKANHGKSA